MAVPCWKTCGTGQINMNSSMTGILEREPEEE
jgi:hypothetical protein